MSSPTPVLFAGYFGAGNLGDEAILGATLVRFATTLGSDFVPTVAAYSHEAVRSYHGAVETVDVWDVRALAAAVARSELVVWGGGGLLQDHWYVPAEDLLLDARGGVPAHVRVPLLAVLKGVPCMMYAQGVGPLAHPESRRIAALVCDRLSAITVRDRASAELLRSIGVVRPPLAVTADPALATVPVDPAVAAAILQRAGLDMERRPRVLLAPRIPPDNNRGWMAPLVAALRKQVLERGGAVGFLAFDHRPEGDEELCRELAARCGGLPNAAAVTLWLSASECAGVLSLADAAVATRLHGLLLAAVAGTPAVALDYDPKVHAFAEELGVAVPVLSLPHLEAESLEKALDETLADAAARRTALPPAVARLRAREEGNLQTALWLLGRGPRPAVEESACGAGWHERQAVLEELAETRRQLEMLRSSRVVRLVERYWGWLGRVRRHLHPTPAPRGEKPPALAPASPVAETPHVVPPPAELVSPSPWSGMAEFEQVARAQGVKGVALVLSGTQLRTDEGQRPMELSFALARQGFAVVFGYWRWSPHERCPQNRLGEGIFQVPLDELTAAPEVLDRFAWCHQRLLLVEFPHPSFVPFAAAAARRGWYVIYDVLDDWAEFHRVGQASWFEPTAERQLVELAARVTAVTPALTHRLQTLGAGQVTVVPNGLRPEVAAVTTSMPLQRGDVTVGYFGYLAGAWFDWELVLAAARLRPSWRFYLVGYGGAPEGGTLPDNVVLLGKQPRHALAALAANWDVGIVPFRAEALAAGADPIKTYEYLAMGLPVVVTGVFPPAGAEAFVERVDSVEGFVNALERAARRPTREAELRRTWAAAHTWDARLAALLSAPSPPTP